MVVVPPAVPALTVLAEPGEVPGCVGWPGRTVLIAATAAAEF